MRLAGGDARVAYNLLEVAAEAVGRGGALSPDAVRRVAQRRLAKYDKEGEEHYNLISALHKSIRNSDVDASLYWLGRMLEGGADARFIARRLLRVASEDVGMADPTGSRAGGGRGPRRRARRHAGVRARARAGGRLPCPRTQVELPLRRLRKGPAGGRATSPHTRCRCTSATPPPA